MYKIDRRGGPKIVHHGQTRSNFFILYSFLPHIIKIDKKVLSYVQNLMEGGWLNSSRTGSIFLVQLKLS